MFKIQNPEYFSLPLREGVRGRGKVTLTFYPLPSRERNFIPEEVLSFEFRYWDLFRI